MTDSRIRANATVARPVSTRDGRRGCALAYPILMAACMLPLFATAARPLFGRQPAQPEEARLRKVVETLASVEFGGRSGAGGDKTVSFLIEQFDELKLDPLFGKEYVQTIPGSEAGTFLGRNVGAMLRGSDEKLRDEWVIVAAHFDHLGVRRGVLYPGADDNASGVAMMLEVARSVVRGPAPPKRSMMFIGFDLEEIGLYGSRYFVAHSPVPLEKVALFVTADMIGRSLAGVCDSHVFVMGTENAPGLRPWIEQAGAGRPLAVGLLGADLLVLNRSDYGPFRSRSIPFLFFTTGENPRYHKPDDTAETLNYPKLTSISQMIYQVVAKAADAPAVPHWQKNPDDPFAEAVTIRDVLRLIVKNSEKLKIGGPQLFLINNTLANLEGIVERGSINPDERARIIQAARLILFTVL
jgi:Peptidase family M28